MGAVIEQTPVHEKHNADLLSLMPVTCKKLIEVGCSSGALAREFKKLAPDANFADLARRHCDVVTVLYIEGADEKFWSDNSDRECWIVGDTLEHLQNSWQVLDRIYHVMPQVGIVEACIPNAQY